MVIDHCVRRVLQDTINLHYSKLFPWVAKDSPCVPLVEIVMPPKNGSTKMYFVFQSKIKLSLLPPIWSISSKTGSMISKGPMHTGLFQYGCIDLAWTLYYSALAMYKVLMKDGMVLKD